MKLDALKKIYFIGIGGIGMSALARFFHQRGAEIEGYDKTETVLTKKLVSEGMKIHYEDDVSMIPEDIDLVVYTPAIPKDHKELNHLRAGGSEIMKRSEVLGLISRSKKCIAISGTHGKTTTSSMTAHLLKSCGMDISCFLGGIANNFGSNYCYGESEWTVIEADEFDRSFHTLSPEIAVLISMDPDHLDIYGAKDKMQESFEIFLNKVNDGGKVIMQEDLLGQFDSKFIEELKKRKIEIFQYGKHNDDFQISNLRFLNGKQVFDFNEIRDLELALPGDHNTENMAAAIAIAELLGIEEEKIRAGVKTFSGIKRRFDITAGSKTIYIDDYAHHPSELRAAISSARKLWPDGRLTILFQPHLYSRTNDFMDDFAEELGKVDELLLMEIYPARELPMEGVTSSVLLEKIDIKNKKLVQRESIMEEIEQRSPEILMTLGAGNIDVFAPLIRDWINKYD
ncbi:UDP-N-acetylmuramate--L-alanine ligase [Portibacter lacus]|uniref:UDP-N-acetylmuramate--L-alanine ligase n=1 Tax=Portibacter lacus TaxID=1099794 RepID=A0AA37SJI1_9BACT|nr:UDP-N-acetylmuramate--L-alanine ligase [Portibacter lacus]GLR15766.1 UDP-N-acetylmuramate--L-alanine ligase [Portibacter lacus]